MHDTTTPLVFMAFFGGAMCGAIIACLVMWHVMARLMRTYRADLERIYQARVEPRKHHRDDEEDDEPWR